MLNNKTFLNIFRKKKTKFSKISNNKDESNV